MMNTSRLRGAMLPIALVTAFFCISAHAGAEPFDASRHAIKLDQQIDWSALRLVAVQDGGRYKTLDSFAREAFSGMHGSESLPGLSPLGSLCDWLFRRKEYLNSPVVRIKDKGLRVHFSSHMPDVARMRIVNTGYMTLLELVDAEVRSRMDELETNTMMKTAMNRAREAEFYAEAMERALRFVPAPDGDDTHPWYTPDELQANLSDALLQSAGLTRAKVGAPLPGISEAQALSIMGPWARLKIAWTSGDAAAAQSAVNDLAAALPKLAAPGVYPAESQRRAEAKYYAMGKFTWGYIIYALAALVSVWALVTGWRVPYVVAMLLALAAMGVHAYGLGLRWSILGRIPVANMFEAVVASAWGGVLIAILLEFVYRRRVFLVAASFVGFLSLILGAFVIPGQGTLTSIMGILDDVMLRIHTVLIILSYALIALAAVIAIVYLLGYYLVRSPQRSAEAGILVAVVGVVLWPVLTYWIYNSPVALDGSHPPRQNVRELASVLTVVTLILMAFARILPRAARFHALWTGGVLAFAYALIWLTPFGFAKGMALTMAIGGFAWALATLIGMALPNAARALADAPVREQVALAGASGAQFSDAAALRRQRPILAGGAPGDEAAAAALPVWLHHADWCHLIILNMVIVMLFVGIVLGAVWADYSWGRPWGWDPKEVFALNTWIIYAILLHMRFITKNRGLWTAWLSVAGALMMAFNWCFVNFFIVGLHSYA
ncbi:MAG: cytochrome c biogenesis protein CcsA [Phycisphaerae bacterium]|nr:cytochrome c biogenesis protein CcsA [Phycisphaerae bacterium]